MRIFWASPFGSGWAIAETLRQAGNRVVYFNPSQNKNGLGFLPEATLSNWRTYAKKADLIVVDDNFTSRQTRRSFAPSDFVQDFAALRAHGMSYFGPTPTSELLEWDQRYLRKIIQRAGLQMSSAGDHGVVTPSVTLTVSRDPDGRLWLVDRRDGSDLVLPLTAGDPLCQKLEPLYRFLDSIKCSTYVNVDLEVGPKHADVRGVHCRFSYPSIFVQLGSLLRRFGNEKPFMLGGAALTILQADHESPRTTEDLVKLPGFFGVELHHETGGSTVAHGVLLGALARVGPLADVVQDLERELGRPNGDRINELSHLLASLQEWGWLTA